MNNGKWVIDRFEGAQAVCVDEERNVRQIPRETLPDGAREGDPVRRSEEGVWVVDTGAACAGRKALRERMNRLWKE